MLLVNRDTPPEISVLGAGLVLSYRSSFVFFSSLMHISQTLYITSVQCIKYNITGSIGTRHAHIQLYFFVSVGVVLSLN